MRKQLGAVKKHMERKQSKPCRTTSWAASSQRSCGMARFFVVPSKWDAAHVRSRHAVRHTVVPFSRRAGVHVEDTIQPRHVGISRGLCWCKNQRHQNQSPQSSQCVRMLRSCLRSSARGHNAAILHALRPGIHDEFTLTQSCADADKGFCSYPLSHSELLSELKGRAYRLIPRCVITQSSGKQRVIDDAHRGGQSETSRDSNKLILCSPLRPAQHAQALVRNLSHDSLQRAKQEDSLESGGEDWPDAYRHSPMSPDEAVLCVVVWWHPDWQAPAYQVYHGLLFGLPLAVTSFNRYSRLVEVLGRRVYSLC